MYRYNDAFILFAKDVQERRSPGDLTTLPEEAPDRNVAARVTGIIAQKYREPDENIQNVE